jgi:hypothetical protein
MRQDNQHKSFECDTEHYWHSAKIRLSIITLCNYAECRYAEYSVLFIIMRNVVMLSVVMLRVVDPTIRLKKWKELCSGKLQPCLQITRPS